MTSFRHRSIDAKCQGIESLRGVIEITATPASKPEDVERSGGGKCPHVR